MTATLLGVTTEIRVMVLEKLAAGWTLEETWPETARRRGIDFGTMRRAAEQHGYPDRVRMTVELATLRAAHATERAHASAPTVAAEPAKRGQTGTFPRPTEVPPHLAEPPRPAVKATRGAPMPTSAPPAPATASLITQATRSPTAKVRRAGERAQAALDALRDLLAEDQRKREEAAAEAAERERVRREIARLQADLKAAQAALARPGRGGAGRAVDYDTRAVREWANEHGIDCPQKGRYLPKPVVAAWRAATQTEAKEANA